MLNQFLSNVNGLKAAYISQFGFIDFRCLSILHGPYRFHVMPHPKILFIFSLFILCFIADYR
ncbi:Uncharacterised protein [Fluoribacter dumoffii]|uniref:Uncharacterized protein n=1 Tax=Fluoribacter dumoffii TaxID=463 RepID=A0A377G8K3_9GAMM|nr:hypothetical protein Ldum_0645 [Fluoribacter dumoffii NY 23]STO20688.1 Uncharacterised protein [Fluoribacter dumoffii]